MTILAFVKTYDMAHLNENIWNAQLELGDIYYNQLQYKTPLRKENFSQL